MSKPDFSSILIHVGHGKTGSSFIQSSLALSKGLLRDFGIVYPIEEAVSQAAERGDVTSGNIDDGAGAFQRILQISPENSSGRLLLSSEKLFTSFFAGEHYRAMREIYPNADIKILLFVRNPLENAASSFQQALKRGQISMDFSEYLPRFSRVSEVMGFFKRCQAENLDISIVNYSSVRKGILKSFEAWLRLPEGTLVHPPIASVNRSLTRAEQRFQLHLNRSVAGGKMGFLSNELLQRLPNQKSERPLASEESLRLFCDRMCAEIAMVNELIGQEIYQIESIDPWVEREEKNIYTLTETQIQVIVEAFAKRLVKHLRE